MRRRDDDTDEVRLELDRLAADVVRGDPDAIARVFLLTEPMLARIAFSVLRDHAAAQDVVQDVFLKLVGQADRLDDPDGRGLRAWLARAVRNRSIDVLRSGRHRLEDRSTPVPDRAGEPARDHPLEDPELLDALGRLTDDQREAIVLFHAVGLAGDEVAAVMERSRAAVYRLLRRGERQLRICLEPSNPRQPERLTEGRRTT